MMMTWFASVIAPTLRAPVRTARALQVSPRRVPPRRRHHAATGMRAGAAHVKAASRPAVLRVAGERTIEQHLVERQVTLEDVAVGEAHFVLDDVGRARLDVTDQRFEIR